MEFVIDLTTSWRKHDAVWIIVDRLTKSAHFLPMYILDTFTQLSLLYRREVARLFGVSLMIVSDRDVQYTSGLWQSMQEQLDTQLHFNTIFHPQVDGQIERLIYVSEDMLMACVLVF
ncbi:hypothetical protein Scep_030363 [Stephania cephalantha]|uniref:Integrase catalytic domain-containing protein n=1 Tax=Stephania cephalantha TaxID=152367 RepID=A0AAP0HGF1_9MAGN